MFKIINSSRWMSFLQQNRFTISTLCVDCGTLLAVAVGLMQIASIERKLAISFYLARSFSPLFRQSRVKWVLNPFIPLKQNAISRVEITWQRFWKSSRRENYCTLRILFGWSFNVARNNNSLEILLWCDSQQIKVQWKFPLADFELFYIYFFLIYFHILQFF